MAKKKSKREVLNKSKQNGIFVFQVCSPFEIDAVLDFIENLQSINCIDLEYEFEKGIKVNNKSKEFDFKSEIIKRMID